MLRLKSVCQATTQRSRGEYLPYLALEHVLPSQGRISDETELDESAREDAILCEPGDVLFGKLRPYLAKSVLVQAPLLCSTEFVAMRPGNAINSEFLYFITMTKDFVQWADATAYGVKMPRSDWQSIGGYHIRDLPSLEDQQQVVSNLQAKVGNIEKVISRLTNQIALLAERRQAAIDFTFSATDRTTSTRLKYLLRSKPTYGVLVPEFVGPNEPGIPFIRVGDLSALSERIASVPEISPELSNQYSRTVLCGGEVLLGVVGRMGVSCQAPPSAAGANVARAVAVLRARPPMTPLLLNFYFSSTQFRDQAEIATQGDSVQPTLGMRDLGNFEVDSPEDKHIEQISSDLSKLETTILAQKRVLAAHIETLVESRQGIITHDIVERTGSPWRSN